MPKFGEVIGESKTKIYCQEPYVGDGSLQCRIVGLTEVGNEWKQPSYSEVKNEDAICNYFSSEHFSGSASFPTLVIPTLTVRCTVRTHLRRTVPRQ